MTKHMKQGRIYFILAAVALVIAAIVAVNGSASDDATNTNEEMVETSSITTVIQVDENDSTSYDQSFESDTTALRALQALEENGDISLVVTEYDFGTLVDSINGVGDDTTDEKFWIYYINGDTAEVGASDYQVVDGDEILWNYEPLQ